MMEMVEEGERMMLGRWGERGVGMTCCVVVVETTCLDGDGGFLGLSGDVFIYAS